MGKWNRSGTKFALHANAKLIVWRLPLASFKTPVNYSTRLYFQKKKANKTSFICARDPGRGFAWIDAALTCSHINNYIVNEKHELTTSAKDVFNIVKFAIRRRENFQLGGNGWNEQTWVVKLCVDVHATNSNFPLSDGELKSSCYGKVFLAKRKSLAIRTIKLAFHG